MTDFEKLEWACGVLNKHKHLESSEWFVATLGFKWFAANLDGDEKPLAFEAIAIALTCGHDTKGQPRVIATWKPQERTGFDHTAALADDPTLARYKTTTTSRVLRLKPTKEN